MKKILITGAGGFIGSHLVDTLLKKGHSVRSLRLILQEEESTENLPDKDFDIVRADIRDEKAMEKAMKNVVIVYHLAARIDFDGKTYREYKEVNVDGTENLVRHCNKPSFQKFISYSSIGVHGMPADVGPIENWNENHSPSYSNYYGRSKWEAELVVRQAHKDFGLPYTIIRPASVYGPREKGPTLALYKAINSGVFAFIGDAQNKMHYVYVQDLVDATILAAKSKLTHGEFIIAGPDQPTLEKVAESVAKSIGKSKPTFCIPVSIALPLSYLCLLFTKISGISLPLFPSRVKTMITPYYYNISRARKKLKYKPKVTFEEGSNITGEWYQKHGYV